MTPLTPDGLLVAAVLAVAALCVPYGWLDLLSFLLPFRVSWSGSDFCSEVVAAALGLDKPWHTSPGDLWDWAVQQPGARVVPDDELRNAWRA